MTTRRLTEHLPFGEKRDPRFFGQDILSVSQFDREDLETIFEVAHEMYGMVERIGTFDLLKGKVLTNLFYEPSTRTSSSFVAAIERLARSPRSQDGIDAEMFGVIGVAAALFWSLMARGRTGSEDAAREETARFAHELKRLFLFGALRPEAWPEIRSEFDDDTGE